MKLLEKAKLLLSFVNLSISKVFFRFFSHWHFQRHIRDNNSSLQNSLSLWRRQFEWGKGIAVLHIYEKLSLFTILFWGAPNFWKVIFIYHFILRITEYFKSWLHLPFYFGEHCISLRKINCPWHANCSACIFWDPFSWFFWQQCTVSTQKCTVQCTVSTQQCVLYNVL